LKQQHHIVERKDDYIRVIVWSIKAQSCGYVQLTYKETHHEKEKKTILYILANIKSHI